MNDAHNESYESSGGMSVGDRNVERLLRSAYDPVPVAESFAERVRLAMHAAAEERAQGAKADLRAASFGAETPPAAWKMAIAAAIALSVIIGLFSISGRRGEPLAKSATPGSSPEKFVPEFAVGGQRSRPIVPTQEPAQTLGMMALVKDRLLPKPRPETAAPVKLAVGDSLATGVQDRERAQLPDGSIVWLNENTELRVDGPRRLSLAKGEAFFEVAPQSLAARSLAARPIDAKALNESSDRFVVATPRREVTALGTKFVVRVDPQETEVVVAQGKVAVGGVEDPLTVGQRLLAEAEPLTASLDVLGRGGDASESIERRAAPRVSAVLDWAKELSRETSPVLVPASDHAGGALVVKAEDGQETRLSMRKYHVDVHIEDGFARTTIDQTYFNHLSSRQEGTFFFPLPADASISRLAMYVAGKLMEGGMAERQHAAEVFESIKRKMQDPALLEWIDGTTFRMRVFPLEGREEKRIVLSYTQRLPSLYGKATYRFPAGHNLGKVGLWSATVHVKGSGGTTWGSPSHTFAAVKNDNDLTLTTIAKDAGLDRDIVVELTEKSAAAKEDVRSQDAAANAVDRAAKLSRADHELSRYYMLRQRPELPRTAKRERRDWIVLVETSADRDPLLARAQIEVARGVLGHIEHDDTFTLVAAAAATNRLTDVMQPATVENVRDAVARLEDTQLLGALDLAATLAAVKPIAEACGNPYLVHIGSGHAALGPQDPAQLVAALPEKAKYVGIGVGKRWNRALMKLAAAKSGGYFTQINPDEDIAWRSLDLVATLNTPRLLDVKVTDDAGRTWLAFDDTVADGEEVCAIVRLDSAAATKALGAAAKVDAEPKSVTLSGTLDGKPFARTYPIANVADNAGYLPRMWAKLEIDRLLAENAEANKERITTLSKAMYVMSPFTSLLVLENDEMYTQYNVDRGRKDHWAMYPCPESIPVVREPLEQVAASPTSDIPVAGLTDAENKLEKKVAEFRAKTEETLGSLAAQPRFLASYMSAPAWNGRYWARGGYGLATGSAEFDGITVLRADNYLTTFGRPVRHLAEDLVEHDVRLFSPALGLNGSLPSALAYRFTPPSFGVEGRMYYEAMPEQVAVEFEGFGGRASGFAWNAPAGGAVYQFSREALGEIPFSENAPITYPDAAFWEDMTVRRKQLASVDLRLERRNRYVKQLSDNVDRLTALGAVAEQKQLYLYRQLDAGVAGKNVDYYFAAPQLQAGGAAPMPWMVADGTRPIRPGELAVVGSRRIQNLGQSRQIKLTPRPDSTGWAHFDFDPLASLPPVVVVRDGVPLTGLSVTDFDNDFALWGVDNNRDGRPDRIWSYSGWPVVPTWDRPFGNGVDVNVNGALDTRWVEYRGVTRYDVDRFGWMLGRSGRGRVENRTQGIGPVRIEYNDALDKLIVSGRPQDTETVLKLIEELDKKQSLGLSVASLGRTEAERLKRRAGAERGVRGEALAEQQLYENAVLAEPNLPGEKLNLLYEHPNLAYVPLLLHTAQSLASYAPGMYTTAVDAQAVLEAEVPEHRPTLGKIDDAARKLIDRARSRGWQQVTIPLAEPYEPLTVYVDGAGRHRYARYTEYGLAEEVVCDGEHEWRLYAELGLGAKRKMSRYHLAAIEQLVPWLVPTAEDLAVGGDVVRVDNRTVAVVREVEWEVVKVELDKIVEAAEVDASDAAAAVQDRPIAGKPATQPSSAGANVVEDAKEAAKRAKIDVAKLLADAEREKHTTRYEMRLVFVDDGRLSERQWLVDGKLLLRVTYGPSGSIVWSDAEGKNLAERMLAARPTKGPNVSPDTKQLVVLPLPWRRWGTGRTEKLKEGKGLDYVNYTDEEAMHALSAFLADGDASAMQDLIARRYFASPEQVRGKQTAADRRLGFYVLLCLAGCNWQVDSITSVGGIVEKPIPASVLADHPNSPIAWLLARELADRGIGHPEPPAMPDNASVAGDKAGRSLAATLITLRRLYRADDPATAVAETAPDQVAARFLANWQRANAFVQHTRSPLLAMAVLQTMQQAAETNPARWTHLALGYERWAKNPAWNRLTRYEGGRAWLKSRDRRRAREAFAAWYDDVLSAGQVPLIEQGFREAFTGDDVTLANPNDTRTDNVFTRKLLDAAKTFSSRQSPSAALLIAWQAYQLEQTELGDEIVNRTLAALDKNESTYTTLLAIRVLYHAGHYDRADVLLTPLLDDDAFAGSVSLWRLAADLAEKRGRLAESVARWEKVAEMEYSRLGESYEVATAREPFESLMQRYEKLATAIAATSQPATGELVANVVRAADRWRTLDADPSAACLSAAKILATLGKEDLAWAYATTPLASTAAPQPGQPGGQPAESPYAALARQLAERGEVALAIRAYAAAEAAEPKNARLVWDRAQLLEKHARFAEARALYRRLADGEWPAEQASYKQQAAERLSTDTKVTRPAP
ncbi:MAG: hypothetical protein DCC68_04685 [Planctomycetota bacterium]|nr:MAG: hypothetical protein DCC68_04685 [Planctomycetota bacterium]